VELRKVSELRLSATHFREKDKSQGRGGTERGFVGLREFGQNFTESCAKEGGEKGK